MTIEDRIRLRDRLRRVTLHSRHLFSIHNNKQEIPVNPIFQFEQNLKSMQPLPQPQEFIGDKAAIWGRFEYKAAVCFTGYKDRFIILEKELDRVGLSNIHIHWDFPSPYKEVLLNHVPMTKFNKAKGCFFIGYNNYNAIATAYHLGCKSVLVMEDDIRFLIDINKISTILDALPDDFDLAMIDHNKPSKMLEQEYKDVFKSGVNDYWSRFTCLSSSGCYAMSRRCMGAFMRLYEAPAKRLAVLRNNDGYFRTDYLGNNMNLYAARIAPAIQFSYNGCHCNNMIGYYKIHSDLGMYQNMYSGFVDGQRAS